MNCPISLVECNKKYCIASIASVVFVLVLDYLVHGMWLMPSYSETAHLWRPQGEMRGWAMCLSQLLTAMVAVGIYSKGHQGKGLGEGFRFGFMLGMMYLPVRLVGFSVQPIPEMLVVSWIIADFIKFIGVGLIAAKVYQGKCFFGLTH